VRHGVANGLHLRRGFGLGQHEVREAGFAQQLQVAGEGAGLGIVDTHHGALAIGGRGLPRPLRDRFARLALGRRRDGILEVQHDRIGTAGQRLGKTLGAIARHEKIGARNRRPPGRPKVGGRPLGGQRTQ